MDGIRDSGEQCDDGNGYNSDGCNTNCELENELKWFCNTTMGETTTCCPLHVNPVTLETVCDCVSVEQPLNTGFTITAACLKRDIDECNTNNGGCLLTAICTNFNVVTESATQTHMCTCQPNMVGDGITACY
jgi:cysteine-rich repeat protein